MGLSAALLAAVVGYLLYQTFQPDPRFVPITVTVLSQEVKTPAGQFIVPVEVKNLGARTAKDFKGAVSFRTPEGKTEQREFKLDYLGAGASQRVYLYLSEPPSEGQLEAKPLEYRLE